MVQIFQCSHFLHRKGRKSQVMKIVLPKHDFMHTFSLILWDYPWKHASTLTFVLCLQIIFFEAFTHWCAGCFLFVNMDLLFNVFFKFTYSNTHFLYVYSSMTFDSHVTIILIKFCNNFIIHLPKITLCGLFIITRIIKNKNL